MAFHVGQLVECVDDRPHGEWAGNSGCGRLDGLKANSIYTVISIVADYADNLPALELLEIRRPLKRGFDTRRFRPLTEQRLAIFRSLLAPTPTKERETA